MSFPRSGKILSETSKRMGSLLMPRGISSFVRPSMSIQLSSVTLQKSFTESLSSFSYPLLHNNHNQSHTIQRRGMFIQTDTTPNPESLKFLPGRSVLKSSENTGIYATKSDKDEIARSPLLKTLFAIDGVKSIYIGADFVTVTKFATAKWAHVRTLCFSAIMDFYASGDPAVLDVPIVTDTTILDTDDEIVAMIKELLETRIRPAVQEDGGDIRYVGFDEASGVVSVKLAGSCVGCPSSSVTLKNGVENMLMHYVPEVTGVVAMEEENDDENLEVSVEESKAKTYEERLAAAGIPFSD